MTPKLKRGRPRIPEVLRKNGRKSVPLPSWRRIRDPKWEKAWPLIETNYRAHGEVRYKPKEWHRQLWSWEKHLMETPMRFGQLKRLVKKCGGLMIFCVCVETFPMTVAKSWPKFNGIIPTAALYNLIARARHFGVLLTVNDIYPDIVRHDICIGVSTVVYRADLLAYGRVKYEDREYEGFIHCLMY